MKFVFALICLAALLAAGCDTGGDTNYNTYNYYPDTTRHSGMDSLLSILSPAQGGLVEILYDWTHYSSPYENDPCGWGYSADTTIEAEVVLKLPDQVDQAQVYVASGYNGHFEPYSQPVHPVTDTFRLPIYQIYNNRRSTIGDDTSLQSFWVQATTVAGTNYISRTLTYRMTSRSRVPWETVPAAPYLDTLYENDWSQPDLVARWCNQSPNTDRIVVCLKAAGDAVVQADTIYAANSPWQESIYRPLTTYSVWIKALNEYGASPCSDTLQVTTRAPEPPSDLRGWTHSGTIVELQWNTHIQSCDTVLVARHDNTGAWATIATLISPSGYYPYSSYTDSSATLHTVNFYRVANTIYGSTWWSTDSVGVWVP